MLSVDNVSKGFGSHILFEEVSFKLNARERLGVVGRNGHGKTTLLRMIIGQEHPDRGTLTMPRNYRLGYVRQQLHFTCSDILAETMTGLPAHEADHHWKAEKILAGLGFSPSDMTRPPQAFSGGYQVRLNLAKVLVSEPDCLLLDEPTNYLDITSIRWIQRFLVNWPHELMLITHDRHFMDQVVTHILGIHRRKLRKIAGNTAKYYDQIALDEDVYEKTRLNDEKRRREVELFITRFRAKARLANLVQSRIKTLARMEKRNKLEALQHLDFSFNHQPFPAKTILTVNNLSFGYDKGPALIQHLSLTVGAGERLCIVGPNGRGKTTLIRLLAQTLAPRTGQLSYHTAAQTGFFEQTYMASLAASRTVEEEVLYSHPQVDRQRARNACAAMLFEGDAALKKIEVLSGGEKSRVMLAKLLVTPLNLLLLDEPTNHLDMDACDALLAALDAFEGTVIMVTHNEMFLHALAQRLIIFEPSGIDVFDGVYQDFLDKRGWQSESGVGLRAASQTPSSLSKSQRKAWRQLKSDLVTRRGQALKPLEKRVKALETQIAQAETRQAELNQQMQAAAESQDGTAIRTISQELHTCQTTIEQLYDELETATHALETEAAGFDEELVALEAQFSGEL